MRAGKFKVVAAVLASATPLLLHPGSASALEPQAQRGLTFVQTNCAGCHAIGRTGDSPFPEAPPFRTLHERYPVESLAEALAEGITTGHPSMPEFSLDPGKIDDVIAYLKTLER
ncbi:cytochrome c [Methylobacterium nigriterrae]|uniref:cytochrome c n=1 Tax=Methylobacterium nigriterrae TaxID=3127512 RepID=UPI0030137223